MVVCAKPTLSPSTINALRVCVVCGAGGNLSFDRSRKNVPIGSARIEDAQALMRRCSSFFTSPPPLSRFQDHKPALASWGQRVAFCAVKKTRMQILRLASIVHFEESFGSYSTGQAAPVFQEFVAIIHTVSGETDLRFLFTSVRGLLPVGAPDPPLKIAAACRPVGGARATRTRLPGSSNWQPAQEHSSSSSASLVFHQIWRLHHLGLARAPILTRLFLLFANTRSLTVFSPIFFSGADSSCSCFSKGLHSIAECTPTPTKQLQRPSAFPRATIVPTLPDLPYVPTLHRSAERVVAGLTGRRPFAVPQFRRGLS